MAEKKNDINLYIGIFTSSVVGWYLLFTYMQQLTEDDPNVFVSFPLAMVQFGLTICVFCAFTVLYYSSVEHSLENREISAYKKLENLSRKCKRIIFLIWAPVISIGLIYTLISATFRDSLKEYWLMLALPVTLVLVLYGFIRFFGLPLNRVTMSRSRVPFVFILVGCIVHMLLVAELTAGVSYIPEKIIFTPTDTARFKLIEKGYYMSPIIEKVTYNNVVIFPEGASQTYAIDLNDSSFTAVTYSEIHIVYSTPIGWFRHNKKFVLSRSKI